MQIDAGTISTAIAVVTMIVTVTVAHYKMVSKVETIADRLVSVMSHLDKQGSMMTALAKQMETGLHEHEAHMTRLNDIWSQVRPRQEERR